MQQGQEQRNADSPESISLVSAAVAPASEEQAPAPAAQAVDHQSDKARDVAATERERAQIDALIAEKDRLEVALAEARAVAELMAHDLAAARKQIQELTSARDKLATKLAQAAKAAEVAADEHTAARDRIVEITALHDRAVSHVAEIKAWAESVLADAKALHARQQALNVESLLAFIKRRYLGKR